MAGTLQPAPCLLGLFFAGENAARVSDSQGTHHLPTSGASRGGEAQGNCSPEVSVTAASTGQVPGPSHARGDDALVPELVQDARGDAPGEICWVPGACGVVVPPAAGRKAGGGCRGEGAGPAAASGQATSPWPPTGWPRWLCPHARSQFVPRDPSPSPPSSPWRPPSAPALRLFGQSLGVPWKPVVGTKVRP
ncbi:protein SOGA3-like [Apus apus]|uniref:protein SOGA3-like n=1 Tax=Apus apus TaxID=8895 RepID=UPI0021F8B024|nr:protein SOGA3-like [Apus apus]